VLPHVFRELVEVDERGTATRQRAPLARFEDNDAAWTLLQKFTDARLLTRDGTGAEAVVEVAHEALFRHWKRLAEWIETAHDDLRLLRQVRLAAAEWDANRRDQAFLWPDERLKPVYAMVERLEPKLDEMTQDFIRPEAERLLAELENIDTPHQRRATIGERLAVIGDPRPGVGLRADGLPDIVWCEVPGGEIKLTVWRRGVEETLPFTVQPVYIAKYPITFVQFQAFLDDPEGFENDTWWEGLAEGYRKEEMATQRSKFDNHPRDSVSWYQAVAFCRWLSARLPEEAWPERLDVQSEWGIRLPAEWEWQQAATGGQPENEYPWGSEWDNRRANTVEAGLGRATAVGMYPQGAAPVGALDMAGTVWEWCLNEYHLPEHIGLDGYSPRVVRGGSQGSIAAFARRVERFEENPSDLPDDFGFRVACSAPML
jgi:formylglycine-generating enzyme required for sulfatase activity